MLSRVSVSAADHGKSIVLTAVESHRREQMRLRRPRLWRIFPKVQRRACRPTRDGAAARADAKGLAQRSRRGLAVGDQGVVGVPEQVDQLDLVLLRQEHDAAHHRLDVLARRVDGAAETIPG